MALMTVAEVALDLSVSSKQVRRLIDDGSIPVIPCGKGAKGERIDREDLEAFKRNRKRFKGKAPCLSTNVVKFGGSKSRLAGTELENLLAPRRAKKKRSN